MKSWNNNIERAKQLANISLVHTQLLYPSDWNLEEDSGPNIKARFAFVRNRDDVGKQA